VFGRGCDRISDRTLPVLTKLLILWPSLPYPTIVVTPGLVHDNFLPNPLQFNIIHVSHRPTMYGPVPKRSIIHLRYAITPKQDTLLRLQHCRLPFGTCLVRILAEAQIVFIRILWFFSATPGNCLDNLLNYVTNTFTSFSVYSSLPGAVIDHSVYKRASGWTAGVRFP
jgi:hypothetical protein